MTKIQTDFSNFHAPTAAPRKSSGFVFWNQTRVLILTLSLASISLAQINAQIFTFTVICMDDVKAEYTKLNNDSTTHWIERNFEKSLMFSATAIGAMVGLVPLIPLTHTLGLRNVLSICGFASTIGTLFFPLAVDLHFLAAVFCRLLQGVGVSVLLTAVGVVPAAWSPNVELSSFLAILSCAYQISSIIFLPVSGILCDSSLGWRSVYYLFGGLTLISFVLFYYFYNDVPRLHKNVSNKELQRIEDGKTSHAKQPVPYRAILTDVSVLMSWLAFFGGNFGFITLLLYGPTYLREVLHFDVKGTGFANCLPHILCAIYKYLAGKFSDRVPMGSQKTRLTIWLYSSVIGMTIGYLVMAVTSDKLIAQIAFTFALVASGLIIMAIVRILQMRCRQHVHFSVNVVSFLSYVNQLIIPLAVGMICSENTAGQWSLLFIIISIIMIVTNAPFYFLANETAADYTENVEEE